jgi:eukaryotic-like serine/threonine-protein kinase
MKSHFLLSLFSLILVGGLLSACSGSATVTTSWPGLTVTDKMAYVADGPHVYAVDLASGTEKWRYPEKADSKITFFAPPALTKDGQLLVGAYDHQLYSIDATTGKPSTGNWPFKDARDRYVDAPLVVDQQIFAPSADYKLYALKNDGSPLWNFTAGAALWSTPVTDGKALYISSMDHHVYAIDPVKGSQIWRSDDLGGSVVGTPTLGKDGALYVGTFNKELLILDANNGKIVHKYTAQGWVWSGPLIDGDRLYFGDVDGVLYALNAKDLSQIWRVQPTETTGAFPDKPLLVKNTLYYTQESGSLYAVDAATGKINWTKTFKGKLYGSPKIVGDLILICPVGGDGLILALDSSGNQKWAYVPAK